MSHYSKILTWLLRHKAVDEGLNISDEGYIKVSDLLSYSKLKGMDEKQIRDIVASDNKTRFTLSGEGKELKIRANQGHSGTVASRLKEEKYLTQIKEPINPCIHGTYSQYVESIRQNGLKSMSRKHIHCASGLPGTVKSGMRQDCNVYIYIDMAKAMNDGIIFYLSDNDVILTEGVNGILDPKYFDIEYKNKGKSIKNKGK